MKKSLIQSAVLVSFLCIVSTDLWAADDSRFLLLSSTIGPIDSGIIEVLEDRFEKDTGILVRHVGAGTGAALKIAEQGNVDLVLVHARKLEEEFIAKGFGTERIPLMYNDFLIVGPASDPAGIKGMKTATEALKIISTKAAPFVSRGDKSGTHVAEMGLWSKAGIRPSGPWYTIYDKGSEGNFATLSFTDERNAYTVIDRASFLGMKDKIKLVVLVEGDEALLNHISIIPVSPKKFQRVNYRDAMTFAAWLAAPDKGQRIIEGFGKDTYGMPLFVPESKQWIESEKAKN